MTLQGNGCIYIVYLLCLVFTFYRLHIYIYIYIHAKSLTLFYEVNMWVQVEKHFKRKTDGELNGFKHNTVWATAVPVTWTPPATRWRHSWPRSEGQRASPDRCGQSSPPLQPGRGSWECLWDETGITRTILSHASAGINTYMFKRHKYVFFSNCGVMRHYTSRHWPWQIPDHCSNPCCSPDMLLI